MRIHKIRNWYIDLDHVLAVSEIKKKYPNMGEYEHHSYDIWFEIEMAFKSNPLVIGIEINVWSDEEEKEHIMNFEADYNKFTTGWTHYNH